MYYFWNRSNNSYIMHSFYSREQLDYQFNARLALNLYSINTPALNNWALQYYKWSLTRSKNGVSRLRFRGYGLGIGLVPILVKIRIKWGKIKLGRVKSSSSPILSAILNFRSVQPRLL